MADDLGWADVSWHNPAMVTPHLARCLTTPLHLIQPDQACRGECNIEQILLPPQVLALQVTTG